MKITNSKIISAYKALLRLAEKPLPLKAAYALHQAKRALTPQWEFILEQEQKSIRAQGGEIGENGQIVFSGPEKRAAFLARENELTRMKTEIDLPPLRIDAAALPDLSVSVSDLEALDGIVEIGGEEKKSVE